MTYSVKEIYYTLQGEGAQAGRPAVFLRFAGCNLWSGREADRGKGPGGCSRWCDTDFVGTDGQGGGKFATAEELAQAVAGHWAKEASGRRFVVCTGGEPLLQLDTHAIGALHAQGFEVAVETNGTISAPEGLDWICVSPKAGAKIIQTTGNELKLVYPQSESDAQPEQFEGLDFEFLFLQPMDSNSGTLNLRAAIEYCLTHPQWRLSVQMHKLVGLR